jgi:uncharacterized FlaG/YvyC family protein
MAEVNYTYGAGTDSGEVEETSKENLEAVKANQEESKEEAQPDKGASQDLAQKPGQMNKPKTL